VNEDHNHVHGPYGHCEFDGVPAAAWEVQALQEEIRLAQVLAAGKYVVQPVGGFSAEEMHAGFMYTIGLTGRGWPELVVSGFYHPVAQALLMALCDAVQAAGAVPRPGQQYTVPIGDDSAVLRLARRAPAEQRDKPLGWANRVYHRQVPALAVRAAGWPCPRCTPCDKETAAACTCRFECGWQFCSLLAPA
jgi:hypothetical protein